MSKDKCEHDTIYANDDGWECHYCGVLLTALVQTSEKEEIVENPKKLILFQSEDLDGELGWLYTNPDGSLYATELYCDQRLDESAFNYDFIEDYSECDECGFVDLNCEQCICWSR